MVYDCFIFNNELEILDIRLNELNSVVDKFILVESTVTHTNRSKPLHFKENRKLFNKFLNKIIHIVVEDTPDINSPWTINDYQFSQIIRGLKNCKPADIILFGDMDEIPKAKKILEWKNKKGKHKVFNQIMSWYFLNCVDCSNKGWLGTHMVTYGQLKKYKSVWIAKCSKFDVEIPDGGWHLSYIGGVEKIQQKLASTIHQEFNNDKYNTPEHIIKAIRQRKDFLNHGLKFKVINEDFLPEYVLKNRKKFKHLFIDNSNNYGLLNQLIFTYLEIKKNIRLLIRSLRRRFNKG